MNTIIIEKDRAFWDVQHKKDDLQTLSGCSFDETVDFLKVREYIQPLSSVLEVGVGMGYVTEGLSEACFVSALDISPVALERVSEICEDIYTTEQIEDLPKDHFDLIICHNLIQHIPTKFMVVELFYLVRSLKEDGIFAVEFISSGSLQDTGAELSPTQTGVPNYYRSVDYMIKLFKKLNCECDMVVNNTIPGKVKTTGVHVLHVKKIKI